MTEPSTEPTDVLLEETRRGVRILRLNRPARKNALSNELGWALVEAFERAAADDAVRVVGVTGAGDAFCSGADLADDVPHTPLSAADQTVDDLGWVGRFPLVIRLGCDKPVVAGVNGVAVGAGLALAMCADMRIASSAARFHPGYARAGTSPDGGLAWTLPQAIGHERAMRFLLEQEMIGADVALALGLVGEVVEAADFSARFVAYCEQMADVAPIAARQTKRLVGRVGLPRDLEAHLRDEMTYVHRGLSSEDGREAVRAIFEKRKPEWKGR
jgi:2-(1,2-epoxy-1,2-dihydrophenyl)acetyl-CoA isomerase